MHFGLIMANQNEKTKIRILYLLKILHTGCSLKEAIKRKEKLSYMCFRTIMANQNKLESGHYTFCKCCYIEEVLHVEKGSDITVFFAEPPEFQE